MMYILKNRRSETDLNMNEYIIYNDETQEQTRFEDTPKIAKMMVEHWNMKILKPIDLFGSEMINYKHVELKDLTTD